VGRKWGILIKEHFGTELRTHTIRGLPGELFKFLAHVVTKDHQCDARADILLFCTYMGFKEC